MGAAGDRRLPAFLEPPRAWRERLSWRGLAIAWVVVLAGGGGAAALLQRLGPPATPSGQPAPASSAAIPGAAPAPRPGDASTGPPVGEANPGPALSQSAPTPARNAPQPSRPDALASGAPDSRVPPPDGRQAAAQQPPAAEPATPQPAPLQPAPLQPGSPQPPRQEPPPVLHPSGAAADTAAAPAGPALPETARTASPQPPAPAPAPLPPVAAGEPVIAPPDPVLLEPLQAGLALPRIGPDGLAPAQAYARPFAAPPGTPLIAILVDGIGLSRADSDAAIDTLPGAIDLAISAYTPHPDALLQHARAKGHEFLASIPMEPAGAPLNDEGARALTTDLAPEANRANLDAVLGRIQGYVGATGASDGQKGEHFAQSGRPFALLVNELAGRGLLYVNPRVAVLSARLPSRTVDLVLDEPMGSAAIDAKLARLEAIARENGSALGLVGPPRPVTLEHLASWARTLGAKGIMLVPVSALAAPPSAAVFLPGPHPGTDAEPPPTRKAP